ncbi:hypothetical protein MO867_07565 [Microbulbifer sp. OS29]|uniref:Uncharacterized protein n=1 Tax=Microbulbifer okhotskensis TaxID=2926617 RepID=A0A9X2J628_9GAMM|nr:hypothetical protein [Microbulbifer okhotskensis]MCO1334200.1 hypothetical protein [Microbulbifer okhotskensis]
MEIYEMVKSGAMAIPECAKTLGFDLLSYSHEKLEMKAKFYAGELFLNSAGTIQGGWHSKLAARKIPQQSTMTIYTGVGFFNFWLVGQQ